jgi:hypothetical protein
MGSLSGIFEHLDSFSLEARIAMDEWKVNPYGGIATADCVGKSATNGVYRVISCCTRCGSSPSHSEFWAVLSKIEVVLNGSN